MGKTADVLIIGAGILGCFAARNLSRYRLDVAVIEKKDDVCTGITKANTGIIYPGYDQHPGSLKAALCVKASGAFPQLCKDLDVAYKRTGLLMLSFGPNADAVLEKKLKQSIKNKVRGVRILDAGEVYAAEPALCEGVKHALYAENTCVVNPWELGIAAYENARDNGVSFYFGEEVQTIKRCSNRFVVETGKQEYTAKKVLICAGYAADTLWEKAGSPKVRLIAQEADYIVLDTCAGDLIHHVISVEPEKKGEGLTLVPTVNGNILIGPTRRDAGTEPDGATDEQGLSELIRKCKMLIPSMPTDAVIRNFGTARPNPYLIEEDGTLSSKSLNDFMILEEDGLFGMIGVKTPGITCANELGAYISQRIASSFDPVPEGNPDFCPVRKGMIKTAGLSAKERAQLCKEDPDYAQIICRCRQISRAEVKEAIARGAKTVDGVKYRAGTGMGRCQGGYCEEKILHLLSSMRNEDIRTVTRDGKGSEIIGSGA